MSWRKVFRRGLTIIFVLASLFTAVVVGAAIQIFDGTGQYIMSDDGDREFGKKRAQQRAELDAQKKAGVYLTSFSRSVNANLTDDEISAVTNNIIKISDVKIVPVPFETNGEAGLMYRVTLKASIDPEGIYDYIKRDDKKKVTIVQQNNGLRDAIAKNDALIENLKEQYKSATSQAEKDRIRKQMNVADRDFLVNQKLDEGNKLYYAEDYHGAIKLYNEILEFGEYDGAYNNRGNAYAKLGQKERVIQDYNKAIELNPSNYMAYSNRGVAYAKLGQYDRAIQNFNKAIEINPNYAEAYYNRGQTYLNYKKQYK